MNIVSPFNSLIPKDLKGNMEWRKKSMELALDSETARDFLIQACAQDPLFFFNGFSWTYSPKEYPEQPRRPFICYPFQEVGLLEIIKAIGDHDLLIEKSRDMGASYMNIFAMAWCWRFKPGFSGLFVSRVEDYVDKAGNPKAMFWKFDYLWDNVPVWLRPSGYDTHKRGKMHAENPENGAVIDGESTTGNVARGDRRTAILLDEFAAVEQGHRVLSSTRDATNCRLFNSTPNGVNSAFYDIRQTGIRRLRLHWSAHPLKAVGLYTTGETGAVKVLDPSGYPEQYKPILDGKMRSPWYDVECTRCTGTQEIAQELDIDYLGSGYQYFNQAAILEQIRQHARPPMLSGELEYDDATGEPIRFIESQDGHLHLWCLLDGKEQPPIDHKYSAGADVSAGTGASNSCLCGYDMITASKIFEYSNPHIRPEAFAKQCIAICKWFGNAYLIWESNGVGRQFGSRILELSYGNIYLRIRDEAITKKVSDVPGWVNTPENRMMLLGNYRAAVEKGECINRSKEALEDTLEYIFASDGSIEHSKVRGRIDPSGARANHGDRCFADAMAWKALSDRVSTPIIECKEIPVGSLAWRNQQRNEMKRDKDKDGW